MKGQENGVAKSFVGDQEGPSLLIDISLALQGSDSRDWSMRPRKNCREPAGCRQAIRFPIKLPVRYRAGGEFGWGETVNISSRCVLFTTDRALALNAFVEVYIKWPVLLHNSVYLSLIASGTIILVEPGQVTLAIEKYEFRTCVPSFFQCSQSWQLPGRAAPAQQTPSKFQMAPLRVPYPRTPDADDRLECPPRKLMGECTLLQRRPSRWAGTRREISKNSHQRKVEANNAYWERVFQEKFADSEYYNFRLPPHSSPKFDP